MIKAATTCVTDWLSGLLTNTILLYPKEVIFQNAFNGPQSSTPSKSRIILWNVLAFQAGSLNAGGFMACHRFVSHVTGFSTLFGTELAAGSYSNAFGFLSVPIFFLGGSMISALFVDTRLQTQKDALYHYCFGILSLITGLILGLGASHVFGKFGMPTTMEKDYFLLALLCMASGIQNATVTSAYGAVVRTTHLTGLTTDLGIGLMRLVRLNGPLETIKRELGATIMRVSIIGSFTLGSVIAAFIFIKAAYWGFVIPFLISVTLWILSLAFLRKRA